MDYFPGFLDLKGRAVLIVGGGDVALRKARLMHGAGAVLSVVAPETSSAFASFIARNSLDWRQRRFEKDDVKPFWLVVTATGDHAIDSSVSAAASSVRVFCNSVDDPANSSYITPAIVDRSPLIVAISSGGTSPVLARSVREKIEIMLPAQFGKLAELAGRWRGRVRRGIGSTAVRRRFWDRVLKSGVPALALGATYDEADREVARILLASGDGQAEPGKAWLVGAGPGDPDLLTVRAVQILQTADVVLYDRLVSDGVLKLARRDADLVPVGKTPGSDANAQEDINSKLVELVRAGKHVCRLKGGDPLIFARGGEEIQALEGAGFAVEVVPGITAAAGCAAASGIPLTHRDASQSVVLVAAHGKESIDELDWPSLARDRQTLVFYMAVGRFPDLMNKLVECGRSTDTPIAIIERGTLPGQRVVRGRLGQLQMLKEAQHIEPPAILIVGDVAAERRLSRAGTVEAPAADLTQAPGFCAKQV